MVNMMTESSDSFFNIYIYIHKCLPSFPSEVGAMKIMISISRFSFLVNCLMEEDEHNNGERKKERKKDRRKF